MNQSPIKLIVLDVDGKLIREQTLCQIIAKNIGKLDRMNWFEENASKSRETLISAREEMANWYLELGRAATLQAIERITWAPNVHESLKSIRESGIALALASVTWDIAVSIVAAELGITQIRATELNWTSGDIVHMYPGFKAEYLSELANKYNIPLSQTLAVGDSSGDVPMLKRAGYGIYVGDHNPGIENVLHRPSMDFDELTTIVLGEKLGS